MSNRRIAVIFTCVCIAVPVLAVTCMFFVFSEVFRTMQMDADMNWVEDNTRGFIGINKRLPENWDELANQEQTFSHPPIDGIESRVEVNFEFMKNVNSGNREVLPPYWSDARKKVWVYRFNSHPKRPGNQERIIADFLYRLYLAHRDSVQCDHCSAIE